MALRSACDRPADAVGLWEALQAISRLAHAGCSTRDLRVTAFNSQLFSPDRAPLVERAHVDDETMTRVLRALTDVAGSSGRAHRLRGPRRRTARHDLRARARRHPGARSGAVATHARRSRPLDVARAPTPRHKRGASTSVRRKESGTFYTPRSMAEYLVRETLAPLVRDASSDRILRLRVLDPAMGSGAFLVAACRFLADACERGAATGGDRARHSDPSASARGCGAWSRSAVSIGVDLNPVAVQLARLSLWLATLAADAPLTFLDHHLCVGDSLVGASVDDLLRRLAAQPADAPPTIASAPRALRCRHGHRRSCAA